MEDYSHLAHYRVRYAEESDLEALFALATLSGPGMSSLPANRDYLATRLEEVESRHFGDHWLVLEHLRDERVVGCASVKQQAGQTDCHWNFQLMSGSCPFSGQEAEAALLEDAVLVPTRKYQGKSELGSLFLHPDYRQKGVGRFLSFSRYMLIASQPSLFTDTVWSELRGEISAKGQSAFYDAVMGPVLGLPFKVADKRYARSAQADQGLTKILPDQPIRIASLPQEARAAIGQPHKAGRGAKRLLEISGLRHEGVIDLFDGGPLMAASKADLCLVRCIHSPSSVPSLLDPDAASSVWMCATMLGKDFSVVVTQGMRPYDGLCAPLFF